MTKINKVQNKIPRADFDDSGLGGAPRDIVPPDLLAIVGPPPEDPNRAAEWDTKLLRVATFFMIQGLISKTLYNVIRQGVGTLSTATPPAMVMAAAARITTSQEEMKRVNTGPDLDDATVEGVDSGNQVDQKPLR